MRHTILFYFFALTFSFFSGFAFAQDIPWSTGMLLGRGYDSISGTIKGDCLDFGKESIPSQGLGSAEWDSSEISSSVDLLEILKIDAGASLNLNVFSASAEMKILTETQISNYNANFLAFASVEKAWVFTKDISIKPAFSNLPPEQFLNQCGNEYIGGVLTGGTFYVMFVIETTNQRDRDEVYTSIRGSYGPIKANGSVTNSLEQTISTHHTSIKGYYSGSTAIPVALNWGEALELFRNFPASVESAGGTPSKIFVTSYLVNGVDTPGDLGIIAHLYWDYSTLKHEFDYVIDNPIVLRK